MKIWLQRAGLAFAGLLLILGLAGAANAQGRSVQGVYGFTSGSDAFRQTRRVVKKKPYTVSSRRKKKRASRNYKRKYSRRQKRRSIKRKTARKKTNKPAIQKVAKDNKDPVQLIISIPDQRVHVYKGDKRIASSRVSTGRPGYRTPKGVFSIIQKNRRHFSNIYAGAPMPYMQRITWSGVALHAGNVSRPYASHGCIRLPYGFAKSLFRKTNMGAHVVVSSGMASPRAINHETLLQPASGAQKTEESATSTAASAGDMQVAARTEVAEEPEAGTTTTEQLNAEANLLKGFKRPVEAAVLELEKRREELTEVEAALPSVERNLELAERKVEQRKEALRRAEQIVASKQADVREAKGGLGKFGAELARVERRLQKAEKGLAWSNDLIEKRRDNERYEGSWMQEAKKRNARRREKVASIQSELDEVKSRMGPELAALEAAQLQLDKALELKSIRKRKLESARTNMKTRKRQLAERNVHVKKAKQNVAQATRELRASQAREKLPLRILITPQRGLERVKNAQKLLNESGYEAGPVDGAIGKMTRGALLSFQRDNQLKVTGTVTDELLDELYRRAGKEQTANAHMYVRQGFLDLFDVPVEVDTPDRPLGTHLFTVKHFGDKATSAGWTALTVKERLVAGKGKKRKVGGFIKVSAKEALDRVRIPSYARRHLARMLTPGSSIVISDKGISYETGKGTDFVVLTR